MYKQYVKIEIITGKGADNGFREIRAFTPRG